MNALKQSHRIRLYSTSKDKLNPVKLFKNELIQRLVTADSDY